MESLFSDAEPLLLAGRDSVLRRLLAVVVVRFEEPCCCSCFKILIELVMPLAAPLLLVELGQYMLSKLVHG